MISGDALVAGQPGREHSLSGEFQALSAPSISGGAQG